MTERIDHVAKALEEVENADFQLGIDEFALTDLSLKRAQVHATLALVEQQRIANLIALRQADSDVLRDAEWDDVDAAIREALGLS